jgi:hypothetical protein
MKWALWRQERHNGTPEPLPTGSLVEELRADPVLPEALSAALAGPGVIGILERHAVPSWELGPAVAELVAEGNLDRSRILADAFVALTRQDTPSTQKGIAKLLAALDLKGPDLAERMPLVQGLLATSHGSVTAVLLPEAIETAQTRRPPRPRGSARRIATVDPAIARVRASCRSRAAGNVGAGRALHAPPARVADIGGDPIPDAAVRWLLAAAGPAPAQSHPGWEYRSHRSRGFGV